MQFPDKIYYGIEALLFLCNFKADSPWKSEEIAKVICRSKEIKSQLMHINTSSDLKKKLEKIKDDKIENFRTIKDVLGELSRHELIKGTQGQGYTINDNGKKTDLAFIIHLFGNIGLTACTHEKPSFPCPKIDTDKCCSYGFYKEVGDLLRKIFENTTIEQIANKKWSSLKKIIG